MNKSEKGEPKYIAEFPQVLRDAQAMLLQNHAPGWSCQFIPDFTLS